MKTIHAAFLEQGIPASTQVYRKHKASFGIQRRLYVAQNTPFHFGTCQYGRCVRTNGEPDAVKTRAAPSRAEGPRLFPNHEFEHLRTRWKETQTAFVDSTAKRLSRRWFGCVSVIRRLAEVFADERSQLEKQWDQGDNVSNEDLRVAFQRYLAFFDRLPSV